MVKKLELIGIALVGVMTLAFLGILQPVVEHGLSPLFWACAGGALMIIIYRKMKQK